mmetsp:Transcript_19927/g.46690  ORF Transcript_19927/g.46690 Transcript_19927/m.46690 type:complete len:88 (-) Transcript_19927:32-295(-)
MSWQRLGTEEHDSPAPGHWQEEKAANRGSECVSYLATCAFLVVLKLHEPWLGGCTGEMCEMCSISMWHQLHRSIRVATVAVPDFKTL